MIVVEVILWVLITLYLVRFFNSILTIFLEKYYSHKLDKVKVKKYKDIYVLLPALREQKIVEETINWFSNIPYKGKIKYIIVTTEKEEFENKDGSETTGQMVDRILKERKIKNFYHMHYPKTKGNKSSQLNYAVDEIMKEKPDMDNTYISVFDFDSKPSKDTFEKLNRVAILRNNPDVIGQVPINYKNYESSSKKVSNCLLLLSSLQQNLRSCGIEKTKLLVCSLSNLHIAQYCMGACLHLKLKTLVDNDKFPIFVDDLTLGYRLSIKLCNFAYLPATNFVLIPNKVSDCFNQSVLIFKGVLTYLSEIKRVKGHFLGKFGVFIEGTLNVLELTFLPYLALFYVIFCIVTFDFNLLFFLLIGINYLWSISSYINLKVYGFKNDRKITSILGILLSPVWFICKSFGSLIYYKRYIVSKIFKKEIEYKKTVR